MSKYFIAPTMSFIFIQIFIKSKINKTKKLIKMLMNGSLSLLLYFFLLANVIKDLRRRQPSDLKKKRFAAKCHKSFATP